jgi:hypothetical protein
MWPCLGWALVQLLREGRHPGDQIVAQSIEFGVVGTVPSLLRVLIHDDQLRDRHAVDIRLAILAPEQLVQAQLIVVALARLAGLEIGDRAAAFDDGEEVRATPDP